jgi:hypothetical protein
MRIISSSTKRCQDCGEPLPNLASKIFKANDGCCPRCVFLHRDVGLDFDRVEVRNMAVRGQSSIAVPRVQFHRPGHAPVNAIPA